MNQDGGAFFPFWSWWGRAAQRRPSRISKYAFKVVLRAKPLIAVPFFLWHSKPTVQAAELPRPGGEFMAATGGGERESRTIVLG